MMWPFVIAGYLAPALLAGLGLRRAGDLFSRWGRSAGNVARALSPSG
jgi:hypothetical protein